MSYENQQHEARKMIQKLALKLLERSTDTSIDVATMLSQCEQTVALAKAELSEQEREQPKAGAA